MRTPLRALTAVAIAVPLAVLSTAPVLAAPKGRNRTDTTAPTVSIAAPSGGSTTGTDITVSGSASDNVGVAGVSLQLDGGAWWAAGGTTSWQTSVTGLASGSHTVTAKAADTAGNTRTTSTAFTVSAPAPSPTMSPTPSPTPSPTASPSPSPSPSATASPTPTATTSPSPTPTATSGPAPSTQGTWTSPEGVTIVVNSAGPWTISQIYSLLLANARDLTLIGPALTVNVQDTLPSQTTTGATQSGSTFTGFQATMYLKGVSSTFASRPDAQLTHEYGHAWTYYWFFMKQGGDWAAYLGHRWSTADGSVVLGTDSRTGTSYTWDPAEIIADDYRLLFGSATAVSQMPNHLNSSIVAPSGQPDLKSWLLTTWA